MKRILCFVCFLLILNQTFAQSSSIDKIGINNMLILSMDFDSELEGSYWEKDYNGCYNFVGLSPEDIDNKVITIDHQNYKKSFGDYVLDDYVVSRQSGYPYDDNRLYLCELLCYKSDSDKIYTILDYDESYDSKKMIMYDENPSRTVGFFSKSKKSGSFQFYELRTGSEDVLNGRKVEYDSEGRIVKYGFQTITYNSDNNISKIVEVYPYKTSSIELSWNKNELTGMKYTSKAKGMVIRKYSFDVSKHDSNGRWNERTVARVVVDANGKETGERIPIFHQKRTISDK